MAKFESTLHEVADQLMHIGEEACVILTEKRNIGLMPEIADNESDIEDYDAENERIRWEDR